MYRPYQVSHGPGKNTKLRDSGHSPLLCTRFMHLLECSRTSERVQHSGNDIPVLQETGLLDLLDDRLHIYVMSRYAPNSRMNTNRHHRPQGIPQHGNIIGHLNKVLLLMLRVQILLQVRIRLAADLDVGYVESIHDILDDFWFASRGSGQRENAKVRIMLHHVPDDLCICVVARSSMSFICDNRVRL